MAAKPRFGLSPQNTVRVERMQSHINHLLEISRQFALLAEVEAEQLRDFAATHLEPMGHKE